jgi:hypothetical protein
MRIEADMLSAYSLSNEPTPEGVTVQRSSGGATKSFDVVLNINVDLTLISAIAAASWVLNEWRENVSLVGPVQMADSHFRKRICQDG